MPANPYASTAYQRRNHVESTDPREIEGRALVEASRRLILAYNNPNDYALADDALDFNWQLWTIFQTEANLPDCHLPDNMRVTILELCKFIDKSVIKFFANRQENIHLLKLFADMNQNIASGLFKKAQNKD